MLDVIIIGAGPAGLMAAKVLKRFTDNFLIIDMKKEIGKPLRCGEGIGVKEFYEFFQDKDYSFIKNKVASHEIIFEDLRRKFEAEFFQLDRKMFEKWLSKDIEDNLKLNTKCVDILFDRNWVEVVSDESRFKAKIIILCYGANYSVQKKLGIKLGIKNSPEILIAGYGGIFKVKSIDNKILDKNKFYYFFDKKYVGYMWVFPKTEKLANIGFGAFNFKGDIKKALYKILQKYRIEAEQISEYSGVVPCSGPIRRTYDERIMVCGNAAGQVYAGTGEGIYYALKSGKIAAETAIKALKTQDYSRRLFKKYEKKWKKAFGKQMKAGTIFAEILGLSYKFGIVKKVFAGPTEEELKKLVMKGTVPYRARVFYILVKLFNLRKKRSIPKTFTIIYKILNMYNKNKCKKIKTF